MLKANVITCSMSRRGECYNNAAMDSWFSAFKFELGEKFESYAEAREESFDYIEVFYNQGGSSPPTERLSHSETPDQ